MSVPRSPSSPHGRSKSTDVGGAPRVGVLSSWRSSSAGAIGPVLLVSGLERVPAATASLLLNFELVATVVLAAFVFREHLGRRLLVAVCLVGLAGVVLVWEPGVAIDVGGLLVIGACIAWGIDNSVTARIDQLSPEQITFTKGAVAGTANLVLGIAVATASRVEFGQIGAALLVGALGYGASITLWVKGARDLGAARGQVIFATAPFVGAVLAWTLLGKYHTFVQALCRSARHRRRRALGEHRPRARASPLGGRARTRAQPRRRTPRPPARARSGWTTFTGIV